MTVLCNETPEILLASASLSRAYLLAQAGLKFAVQPADIDESAVKEAVRRDGGTALKAAKALAELKAIKVSAMHSDALVIGADQILDLEGRWFDKPGSLDQARRNLETLRGKTHTLATAAVIAVGGRCVWQTDVSPNLTMRRFTDAFLDRYIQTAGEKILLTVGAYHLGGPGVQLFSRIEGDFFSILGLPLLPVLRFLRDKGALIP